MITLREVAALLHRKHRLEVQHKLVFELGWRAYFRHVWAHRKSGICASLHPGPLPDAAYASRLPADIREARCGVPAIDQAIRTLYSTGLLHNHARMWLASYIVHLRRIHWRAGADWMIGHLLDGDLASNHLSWQWVAGTASRKPYLFNAENVARHAPRVWWSPASAIDRSYAELETIARGAPTAAPTAAPTSAPTAASKAASTAAPAARTGGLDEPDFASLESTVATILPQPLEAEAVWVLHPWALRAPPPHPLGKTWTVVGCLPFEAMGQHAWSVRRLAWVSEALRKQSQHLYRSFNDLSAAVKPECMIATWAEPHLSPFLGERITTFEERPLFAPVAKRCDSFSRWWAVATQDFHTLGELLDST
jgi:deoxyribodipyrimidine photo-lyase